MHTLNLTFQIALKAWIFPSDLTIGFPTLSLTIKMMMILKWWKKNDNEMNTMKYEIKLSTLLCHAYCETTEGFQMHCDVIIMVQLTWWDLESHVSILKKGVSFGPMNGWHGCGDGVIFTHLQAIYQFSFLCILTRWSQKYLKKT